MEISQAEFVKSSQKISQLPEPNRPEYAFTGRSNVGKSSLINYLCNRRNLAMTSGTPGKTQLINHFLINKSWYQQFLFQVPDKPYFSNHPLPIEHVSVKLDGNHRFQSQ
ncbi:MAG: GTPase, partial [Bacteroidota bacterium]